MFTLMAMICFGNTFNECKPLILNTRMEEKVCREQVAVGIDSVLMDDGKWYSTDGIEFSCVREV